jgi:phosphoribosylformylglycinamidine synthase
MGAAAITPVWLLTRLSPPNRPLPVLPAVRGANVARVVVDVMLKPEILDPQGKAVHGALPRLGFEGVIDVRQGKRFELEFDGEVTEERLAEVRKAAETLLSNPVIEDYTVRVEQI